MAPTTRSATAAKLRRLATIPRSACDWLNEVFDSKDLGPLVLERMDDLEDIASYARTCRAMRLGSSGILFKLNSLARTVDYDFEELSALAGIDGNVRLYQFCIRKGVEIGEKCAEAAIAGGQIEILRRMHFVDANYKLGVKDMAWAAHRGQRHILEWMKGLGIQWDEVALRAAAMAGRTDCLEFILDKGHIFKVGETFAGSRDSFIDLDPDAWPMKCTALLETAAEAGHLDCVKLIKEKCAPAQFSISAANRAAGNGHLHVLKWMWPQMSAWASNTGMYAIEGDHVECFQFVWEKLSDTWEVAIPWHQMFDAAVLLDKPKCLRFLLGTGRFVILDHIRHQLLVSPLGGTECLRVCAEHGVEFTAEELTQAVLGVNLEIVTTLVNELNVPWEEKVLEKLVLFKHKSREMFAHCLELGAPAPSDLVLTLCMLGESSMLEHYLAKRKPVFDDIEIQACAKKHQPECARVLIEHHGNKKEMRQHLKLVFAHPCMAKSRPKAQAFMNHVFGF